jgi:hypothetical protein
LIWIAKSVFQLHGVDTTGKVVIRARLSVALAVTRLRASKIPDIANLVPVLLIKIPDIFPRDLIKKPLWHRAFLLFPSAMVASAKTLITSQLQSTGRPA